MIDARLLVASLAALAFACTSVPALPIEDAVILAPDDAARLLDQCSRSKPEAGEGAWALSWEDIRSLEAHLPSALIAEGFSGLPPTVPLRGWHRQYVGTVRDGRKLIYGNYFPAHMPFGGMDWRSEPIVVCDGGPNFFGVEYDVEAKRITHLSFNGAPPRTPLP
jgi:hypothetical protein